MTEQIIIRLNSRPDQAVVWLVWSAASSEVIASGQLKDSSELPALAERLGARPVVALVPAADVVMTKVALPGKPNRQLLQALPYMLEEEHAEDIDQLFLALGPCVQQEQQYWQQVALCKKVQLEQWLAQLTAAGFTASRMLPDALLLPLSAQAASAIELAGQWLVRQSDWQATSIDSSWWADYLALADIELITSYSPWPEQILQQVQLAEPELPLALLAAQLPEQPFSLLQGPYQPKKPQSKIWLTWKTSMLSAAACALIYLSSVGLQVWQQGNQLQQQRAQLVQLYKSRFPGESTRDISRALARKTAGAGQGKDVSLFGLLQDVQRELAATEQVRLDSLRYDQKSNELRFQAQADSFQRFDSLKTRLEQQGFEVKQGALSNEGNKVVGTVSVRVKS